MNGEPDHEEVHEDDNQPATKADIRSLRTEIEGVDQRLINVEGDVSDLKSDVASLKDTTARVLDVVESIDQRLKDWRHIPEEVTQLKEDVADLQLRR